ncbi:MAG: NAD(P)/FAD-dependent oxidoreductase [Burkholderiales bacterium]|nr:MAG: NAD(P)/FAD-dependent oxidoreductase [Burkholderiales bacterium]
MESIDTLVVGAGVIGLAIARALAATGRELVIVEAQDTFGTVTSARNSEVLHAGIYYAPGSLKARLCVAGRRQLVEYARRHGIGHRLCGKFIVAQEDVEIAALERIEARAQACGVDTLCWLSAPEARAREPRLVCRKALWSPDTGVIDSHGLMLSLLGEAEDRGAALALRSRVLRGRIAADGHSELEVQVVGESEPTRLRCRELVNAAGLEAQHLAHRIEGLPQERIPPRHLAKGCYFTLSGRSPFASLIYPIPTEAGLGTHLTLDLAGQARFGPDVEWVDEIDYRVNPARAAGFYADIRRYWPELPDGALQPGYAGVRPKVVGPGADAGDFRVLGPGDLGVAGQVHLFGIESPGLTAALAIAEHVVQLLAGSD